MGSEKKSTPVLSQSLFETIYIPSPTWRSFLGSSIFHGAVIVFLLMITVPVLRNDVHRRVMERATLIAPQIPEYHPKVVSHPHIESRPSVAPVPVVNRRAPVMKPIEAKPAQVVPQVLAAAPEIKVNPLESRPMPEFHSEPVAPKPQVRTGSFETSERAKGAAAPQTLKVGGFGDPNGVPVSTDARPSAATLAAVGSFDLPEGSGRNGGGGRSSGGGVRQTSFGDSTSGGVPGGTGRGTAAVRTGGFGETTGTPPNRAVAPARPAEPAFTPVEILSKPKPVYTEEARNLRLEGQVTLDVVFLSNGSVRILRVNHGLGHGLDEAAQEAALHVHFRPATRAGVPVDMSATIRITFQLT